MYTTEDIEQTISEPIVAKIARWKEKGRKIVKDERGLYFYEGMTPKEKIEWIENEIEEIKKKTEFFKKLQIEDEKKSDTDYFQEFYAEKYGLVQPDMRIKDIQKRAARYVKDCRQADADFIKNRIKENKDEIREYEEDIKFYKTQANRNL